MRTFLALALALSASVAAPALADDRGAPDTTYDFMDDLVTGGVQSPILERIELRRLGSRGTLIRARAHFIPELTKSVEHL